MWCDACAWQSTTSKGTAIGSAAKPKRVSARAAARAQAKADIGALVEEIVSAAAASGEVWVRARRRQALFQARLVTKTVPTSSPVCVLPLTFPTCGDGDGADGSLSPGPGSVLPMVVSGHAGTLAVWGQSPGRDAPSSLTLIDNVAQPAASNLGLLFHALDVEAAGRVPLAVVVEAL